MLTPAVAVTFPVGSREDISIECVLNKVWVFCLGHYDACRQIGNDPIIVSSGTDRYQKTAPSSEIRSTAKPEAFPAEETIPEALADEVASIAAEAKEPSAEPEIVSVEYITQDARAEEVTGGR
jgi:hypothetical protein